MILLGTHFHLTVPINERGRMRAFYQHVLGCELRSHDHHVSPGITENLDLFHFPNKEVIGVEYVDDGVRVADNTAHKRCIWLELYVDDVDDIKRKLLDFGVDEITDFWDKGHFYFHAPGGQVYRLVQKDER